MRNRIAAPCPGSFREDVGSSRNVPGTDKEEAVDASEAGPVFIAVGNPPLCRARRISAGNQFGGHNWRRDAFQRQALGRLKRITSWRYLGTPPLADGFSTFVIQQSIASSVLPMPSQKRCGGSKYAIQKWLASAHARHCNDAGGNVPASR